MEATVEKKDMQKRQGAFGMKPRTVLVKLYGLQNSLPGVEVKRRDQKQIEAKHKATAAAIGVQAKAYRQNTTDSGLQIIKEGYGKVTIEELLEGLDEHGLVFTGCHCYPKWGKNKNMHYVHVLEFNELGREYTDGEGNRQTYRAKAMPQTVANLLDRRSWTINVWANRNQDEHGSFRLDTINLSEDEPTSASHQKLAVDGRTYRMV